MSHIRFKIAAKTDVGRVRENNEDNFQAASDLAVTPMRWVNDEACTLGAKGALLVVADGMGGMNAGEVASEIAIDTVRDYFRPENITDEVVKTRYTIERFMKNAIVEADGRIKKTAKERPETHGMGTTIVIAWLLDGNLYIAWCGDSRGYVYNPAYGLRQLTKDHSYVQDLVDRGAISPEDAFDYPDNNIITRSLSDASVKARPDCLLMPHELADGDVVLLCTDGLNGMIRDHEIEQVLAAHYQNMDRCADALIAAACDASGHDNVTVAMCHVLSGAAAANANKPLPACPAFSNRKAGEQEETSDAPQSGRRRRWLWGLLVVAICLLIGASAGFYIGRESREADKATKDSVSVAPSEPKVGEKVNPSKEETFAPAEEEDTKADQVNPAGGAPKEKGKKKTEAKPGEGTPVQPKPETRQPAATGEGEKQEGSADPNELTPVSPGKEEGLTLVKGEGEEAGQAADPHADKPDDGNLTPETYTVKRGDNLKKIAEKFGLTEEDICRLNGIANPHQIKAGQTLRISKKRK